MYAIDGSFTVIAYHPFSAHIINPPFPSLSELPEKSFLSSILFIDFLEYGIVKCRVREYRIFHKHHRHKGMGISQYTEELLTGLIYCFCGSIRDIVKDEK